MGQDNSGAQTPAAVERLVRRETEVTFHLRDLGASVAVGTLLCIVDATAVVAAVAAGARWGFGLAAAVLSVACVTILVSLRLLDYDDHLREGQALYEEISDRCDGLLRSPLSGSDEVRRLGTSSATALSAFHFGTGLPLLPLPGRRRYHLAYLVLDLALLLATVGAAAVSPR